LWDCFLSEKDTRLSYILHPPRTHKIPTVLRGASEIFNMLFECGLDKLLSHTGSLFFFRRFMAESLTGRCNYYTDGADFETLTRQRPYLPGSDSIPLPWV
jgi:hypothetical protein